MSNKQLLAICLLDEDSAWNIGKKNTDDSTPFAEPWNGKQDCRERHKGKASLNRRTS